MADYVVHYDSITGQVLGMFPRTTSDNISTYVADGYLEVDGVKVVDGIDAEYNSNLAVAVLTNPTDVEAGVIPGVFEVDVAGSPTDVATRTDDGRNPNYEYTAP